MDKPRLLSLCSGIGAIDLAAMLAGCEIAGQVEIDPFGQAVLRKNFGDLPRRGDIKEVATYDAETLTSIFGNIDIVAGGIPCQPFSCAGQRRGVEDDRHLWPYAFAIIEKLQPAWVLIENVRNFVPLALDLVLADLESADYEARAIVLPACAIGAPHIRERCFVLAYLPGKRSGSRRPESAQWGQAHSDSTRETKLADTNSDRQRQWANQQERQPWSVGKADARPDGTQRALAHAGSAGRQERDVTAITGEPRLVDWRTSAPINDVADTQHGRCEWRMFNGIQPGATRCGGSTTTWAEFESGVGRDAHGTTGWLDGHIWPALPGEAQHPHEPPRTITGKLPDRSKRLKTLGNAVVWQQVYPFFAFIAQQYAAHL